MLNVLVPVGSGKLALGVVEYLVGLSRHAGGLRVHLLYVAPLLSGRAARWIGRETRVNEGRDVARTNLTPIADRLKGADLDVKMYAVHGELAHAIAVTADELGCDKIVMGSRQRTSLGRTLSNSVANRVMNKSRLPITIVPAGTPTLAERVGLPSGVGAALLILALD